MRELRTAAIAAVAFTVVLGLAYPLAMTGAAQVLFGGRSDGSVIERQGTAVGSHVIGQDFSDDPSLFRSRPSVTGYSPNASSFNNQGPNQQALADQLQGFVADYLERERPYVRDLRAGDIPPDAVTTSASGVDPHISEDNARIQANRVAAERDLPLERVLELVDDHAARPLFGLGGPKSINVLELNLALEGLRR
ncbi:MAG: potassium-transporting ATPase subunit C [Solirubrobacteraceae bacterium]